MDYKYPFGTFAEKVELCVELMIIMFVYVILLC